MGKYKHYADVIVVGAGFAGLRAAQLLRKAGLTVIVLESRVRIGGRCQTGVFLGEHFDVGGHWIGAHQPRVRKLITDMGLKFKAQYDEGTHILNLFGKKYEYSGNISSLNTFGDALEEMGKLVELWDKEMMEIPIENPSACERAKEFDSITLKQWQEKHVKSKEVETLMNFLLWTIFTVTSEEVSYMWWLYYLRQGHGYSVLSDIRGGAQQDKVVGGCQQICDNMLKDIGEENLHLRTPVTEIIQTPFGVTAVTPEGRFSSSRIIVTAPPAVCTDIKFDPPLSAARQDLHERFRPGTVIKVYVLYDKWWWREKGLSGELLTDTEPVTLAYDATTEKVPGFIGFIPAHLAKKWGEVSGEELKKAITKQFVENFGPDAANPRDIIIRPWMADETSSKGAYAGSMPPNCLSVHGSILRTPHKRVHFACTELAKDWAGYFEGAIESAESVAAEVLAHHRTVNRAKL